MVEKQFSMVQDIVVFYWQGVEYMQTNAHVYLYSLWKFSSFRESVEFKLGGK